MISDADNPLPPAETPNRVAHVHHYVLKGSATWCYAECDICPLCQDDRPCFHGSAILCGHKLAGDNGPIVGSRARVESAIGGALSGEGEGES